MPAKHLDVGCLVWAKMKGFPAWPGKIIDPPADTKTPKQKKPQHYVFFFGSNNHAWILDKNIVPHNDSMVQCASKKKSSAYQSAIETVVKLSKNEKLGESVAPNILQEKELLADKKSSKNKTLIQNKNPNQSKSPSQGRVPRQNEAIIQSKMPSTVNNVPKRQIREPSKCVVIVESIVPIQRKDAKKQPLIKNENAKKQPLINNKTAEKLPLTIPETAEKRSLINPETAQKQPLMDIETAKKPSLMDTDETETAKRPLIDTETTKKRALIDIETIKKPALINNETAKKRPFIDTKTAKKGHLIDTETRKKQPLIDTDGAECTGSCPKTEPVGHDYADLLSSVPPSMGYSQIEANLTEDSCYNHSSGILSRSEYTDKPPIPILDILDISESLKKKKMTPCSKRIGFLGLGNMGQSIVKNLLNSGHHVAVWNRTPGKMDELISAGASRGLTPADVVQVSDITFCCVSDSDAVKCLVFGNCGVLKGLDSCPNTNKGYVEMTFIDPDTSSTVGVEIALKGGRYLEAPISGSKEDAIEGTLTIHAAGDQTLFRECESCFHAIGRNAYYVSSQLGKGIKMNVIHTILHEPFYGAMAETMALVKEDSEINEGAFIKIFELVLISNMFKRK